MMSRLPAYLVWLIKDIVVSNIATGRLILGGRARPVMFTTPATQASAGGLVTYANSITLTPGTVTIEVEDADGDNPLFLVHALNASFAADVESGEMDRRVTALEGGGGA
jgi:multicomponent Na+:H+ antiporter subunit E